MPANLLLVDDDPGSIQVMARVLAGEGSVRFATNGADALRLAQQATPDLVLLDAEMPAMGGFEVCAALKADPATAHVPVIFVTSHRDEVFEVAGFGVGAVDFIAKPVNAQLLLVRVRSQLRVKRMADELRTSASTDALTGVANRRRFDETLQREWLRARRARDPLALVLVDVDFFKLYNDHYGHPAGDDCLRRVAGALSAGCLRPADSVARYGGEEFALILPQTTLLGAEHVARRLLDAVEGLSIPHAGSAVAGVVTISAGIACHAEQSGSFRDAGAETSDGAQRAIRALVDAADAALYAAKGAGRARACVLDARENQLGMIDVDLAASQMVASSRLRG
jgi:diguanylate cyclase (GGDEF)-like protein